MAIGVEELTMLALARKYTNKKMAEAHNLHLHWKIVDEVPSAEEANSHTIYLYKIPDAYGDDKYEEWMLIDGEMAKIGETSVDLRDYARLSQSNIFTNNNTFNGDVEITGRLIADLGELVEGNVISEGTIETKEHFIENGQTLEEKYAQLKANNTFSGENTFTDDTTFTNGDFVGAVEAQQFTKDGTSLDDIYAKLDEPNVFTEHNSFEDVVIDQLTAYRTVFEEDEAGQWGGVDLNNVALTATNADDDTHLVLDAHGIETFDNTNNPTVTIDSETGNIDITGDITGDTESQILDFANIESANFAEGGVNLEDKYLQIADANNQFDTYNTEIQGIKDKNIEQDETIQAEVNRALEAENTLDDKIEGEIARAQAIEDNLGQQINAEEVRAREQENTLEDLINSEINRATVKDNELDDALAKEIARAKKAETDENARAEAKENELETKIDSAQDQINILNGTEEGSVIYTVTSEIAKVVDEAPDAFDTLKEIAEWIDTHEDTALEMNEAIQKNKADISSLSTTVENYKEELDIKNTAQDGALDAETQRATTAEQKLDTQITEEQTRAETAESELTTNLETEVTRATNRENEIESNLNAEITRAKKTENTLDIKISTETTRAQEAEEQLTNDLSAEVTRAMGRENDLEGLINSAQNAIDVLNGKGEGSVTKQVSDAIDSLVDGAPEALDTLKEIDDWIKNEGDAVTKLTTQVSENTDNITNLTQTVKNNKTELDAKNLTQDTALQEEINRAKAAEKKVADDLVIEVVRAKKAEEDEAARAEAVEQELADNISALQTQDATFKIEQTTQNDRLTAVESKNTTQDTEIANIKKQYVKLAGDTMTGTLNVPTIHTDAFYGGPNDTIYSVEEGLVNVNGDINIVNIKATGNISAKAMTADTFTGNLKGNADTATKLSASKTINGTAFDGSKNITTNFWGSAREITIGNAQKSIDGKTDVIWSLEDIGAISSIEKGAHSGVAPLDANGKIDPTYLPSYVSDVFEYPTKDDFPAKGETNKIYVAVDTNLAYRWSGTVYIEISKDTNTTYTFSKTGDTLNLQASSGQKQEVVLLTATQTANGLLSATDKKKIDTLDSTYLSKNSGGTMSGPVIFEQNVTLDDRLTVGGTSELEDVYIGGWTKEPSRQPIMGDANSLNVNGNTHLVGLLTTDSSLVTKDIQGHSLKLDYYDENAYPSPTTVYGNISGAGAISAQSLTVNGEVDFHGRLDLSGTLDMGTNSLKAGDGTFVNTLRAKSDLITHNIEPEETNLYKIGNNNKYYSEAYLTKIYSDILELNKLTVKNSQTWNKTSDPADPNAPINSFKVRDDRIDIFKEEGSTGVSNIKIPFSRNQAIEIHQNIDLKDHNLNNINSLRARSINVKDGINTLYLVVNDAITLGDLGRITFENMGGTSTTGSFNFIYQDAKYNIGGINSDITFYSPDSFTIDIDGQHKLEINNWESKLRLDENNSFSIENGEITANTEIFKLNGTADSPNGGLFQTRLQMSYNQRDIWELQEVGSALYIRYEDSTLSSPSFKTLFSITSGGNVQLGTQTIGSNTQPIYLNAGKFTTCTNITASSVPWSGITNKQNASTTVDGLMSKEDKSKLDGLTAITTTTIDSWFA